jgi:hypothetical protein
MLRTVVALIVACASSAALAAEPTYDVVVYGGTSGGVAAAVQVVRMGKTVVLIEPSRHLGGLTSGGLGATDIGNKAAIGGIAREFYGRIHQHYANDAVWKYQKRDEYKSRRGGPVDQDTMWTFEPHVAEAIYGAMVRENKIPVVLGERLDLKSGVKMDGQRITAIVMESGKTFRGRMFIDATYEGDLMAKAGVSYTVGREANSQYGETLNGVQTRQAKFHQFVKKVDPYVKPGDPSSGLLPGVHAGGPGEEGSADKRVQAYNFRMCTTDVPENRRAWPKPEGYDEKQFELVLRNCEAGDLRVPWAPVWMPNRKTDTNNNFAISTDNIGMNYDYPDGDYATRERIVKEHENYQKGLMWTLANNPRVPEKIRAEFQRLGLAKDEFLDNDNWPHQLYVREARRMVSDYVMTEHNCVGTEVAPDPVGLGAYGMDSHNTQRYVSPEGFAINEGDVEVGGFSPYPVSYRSIVPKRGQCTNVLVPVCLSATHISYGSIRMEPVFMILGQSAATAAVQAIQSGVDVQSVDYPKLRERLLVDKQILAWTGPRRGSSSLDPKSLDGLVVDNDKAILTGEWLMSTSAGPFVGANYLHDEHQGAKSARFEVNLPKPGRYEVRLSYTVSSNRATNVPVTVRDAAGEHTVKVNQRATPPLAKAFVSLGVYTFASDQPALVTISNAAANGHVIVDSVQFLPAR